MLFGYARRKSLRSCRAKKSIVNLRNVWAYGNTEHASVERNGISVVMRWVYAAKNYPGQRSVRCKQEIGCLEYANCGSIALDMLAGRFRYYSWRSCKARGMRLSYCVWESGSAVQRVSFCLEKGCWIGNVQQHHQIGSGTNLQVGVLRNCSFVGFVIGLVFSSHVRTMKN